MKTSLLFGLFSISLFVSSLAYAETKIATVDIARVLNESTEAKGHRKVLDAKMEEAKKKIEAKRATLKAQDDKVKANAKSASSKDLDKLEADTREFNRFVHDNEESLKKDFLKTNKELTEKTVALINTYAQKNGIDLVLEKHENSSGPVLFGNKGVDISDAIIKELNS